MLLKLVRETMCGIAIQADGQLESQLISLLFLKYRC